MPVARAVAMRRGELFEPEYPLASAGDVVGGGAAHATEPDDDGVVVHGKPLLGAL